MYTESTFRHLNDNLQTVHQRARVCSTLKCAFTKLSENKQQGAINHKYVGQR